MFCTQFVRVFRSLLARGLVLIMAGTVWLGEWSFSPALAAFSPNTLSLQANLPTKLIFPPPDPQAPDPDERLSTDSTSQADNSRLLLPDLRTLQPYDLNIVTLPDGTRELRLSNTIWNSGAGALELEGKYNPDTRMTRVDQHLYAPTGTRVDHLVGEFVWHPTHDHWHFEDFSLYELWTLTRSGGLDTLVSSSDKVSYCVIDTDVIDSANNGFLPRRRYYGCGRSLQGLSAGWGDTYKSYLDGQSLQLAVVQDGFYALKSTANPDAILLESNYRNNFALLYLEIRGERLKLIDPAEFLERHCQDEGWLIVPGILCKM